MIKEASFRSNEIRHKSNDKCHHHAANACEGRRIAFVTYKVYGTRRERMFVSISVVIYRTTSHMASWVGEGELLPERGSNHASVPT